MRRQTHSRNNSTGTITIIGTKITDNTAMDKQQYAQESKSREYIRKQQLTRESIHKTTRGKKEGCKIIELNGDGRLQLNGAEMYVEQMNLMEGGIMVIVDTGLLERAAKAFTREIQNIDPTIGIKIAAVVDSQGHGRAVGGIIDLVRGPWNAQVGHLHQYGSSMGLMGKMSIRGGTTNLTLIYGYWPIKGSNSESTQYGIKYSRGSTRKRNSKARHCSGCSM